MAKLKFDELSKPEQRVVIAKDLIKRLDAKKFFAKRGKYLSARGLKGSDIADESIEVRDLLKDRTCQGCQIGGLFLCLIDRKNALSLRQMRGDIDNDSAMRRYLSPYFPARYLKQIEAAFEGWDEFVDDEIGTPDRRMRAIATNIIKNNGEFKPQQLRSFSNRSV